MKDGRNEKITLIYNAAFVIGCEEEEHYIIRGGEVAYKGNTIIYVGRHYIGESDEKIDAGQGLVIPGLINLHCHIAGSPLEKGFIEDTGNRFNYMSGLYEYLSVTKLEPEDQIDVLDFSLADIMTRGSTTVFEQGWCDEKSIEHMGESGLRTIVGPVASSSNFMTKDGRNVYYNMHEQQAYDRLQYVMDTRQKYDGAYDGRMTVALYLGQVDCCTPEYLDEVRRVMDNDREMIVTIHAAQSINEYEQIARTYGKTPAGYLYDHGIVGSRVHYGHYLMPQGHSMNAMKLMKPDEELKLIAGTNTNIIHCPWSFGRRGMILESLQHYLDLGINMGIGTDTFTQDIIWEMRYAAIFCKIAEGANPFTGTAAEVFNMATLGGARAIGRPDLGRIQKGCKADIVIVDLNNLDCQPVRDPIKVLVYSACGKNVDKVIVDGKLIVDGNRPVNMDIDKVIGRMQQAQDKMIAKVPERDWAGRSADEMSPMSFRVVIFHIRKHIKCIYNSGMKILLYRIRHKQDINSQFLCSFTKILCKHHEEGNTALHITDTSSNHPASTLKVIAEILGQLILYLKELLFEFVARECIIFKIAIIINTNRVHVSMDNYYIFCLFFSCLHKCKYITSV